MKKLLSIVLTAALLLSLTGCMKSSSDSVVVQESDSESVQDEMADEPATDNDDTIATESEDEDDEIEITDMDTLNAIGDVEVDSGIFNVTITIPADLVSEDTTQEALDETAKEQGYKSATLNEDGTVTYVMTKAQHKKSMDEMRQSINESLSDLVESGDYPDIVSITANDDFTEFSVVVSTEEVGISESIMSLALYMYGGIYNIYNGTTADNIHVEYINKTTGNVIDELNSNTDS
jgi:hypothetical protein